MSMLDKLTTDDKEVKTETDSVGSNFSPLDSAIYQFKILLAYITVATSEAMALNVLLETPEGKQIRQQFWMTSGKAKGCKNYYVNKKGEKHYLPGFNQANGIALLVCDKGISQLATETKTIELYNYDAKKEVPTDVDMVTELLNKEFSAGVIKQIVDKNEKDANGVYQPTGETREENEVDKLFHTDGRTIAEIRAQETDAKFQKQWLKRWEGKTKDKSAAKAGVVSGAPKSSAPAANESAGSLFK